MDYRIEQLRYQLREDPSSRVFYALAEELRRRGEAEEAVGVLRGGLDVHPRYAAAWVSLGRCLRDLDDAESAATAFGRALELDRSNLLAARAAGELAADRNDWVGAIEAYRLVEEVLPDDPDIAGRIAELEACLAEEAAAREALAAAPPAEVVRLADGDPFADVAPDEAGGGESDDVFGGVAVAAEAAAAEPAPADGDRDLGGAAPAVDDAVVDDEWGPASDEALLEAVGPAIDDVAPAEVESWADVTGEDGETFEAVVVPPPPEDESAEAGPEPEAGPGEELAETEAVGLPEVPEFVEPIIEESAEAPDEPEPESWSDLAEGEVADDRLPVEGEEGVAPIIPETLAAFDRPTVELDEEEAEPVQPGDVPMPTLTLARLALQQGDDRLAEATLVRLLDQDPANHEAAELLAGLRPGPDHGGRDATSAKVAALRGWLDTIRLASERQQT